MLAFWLIFYLVRDYSQQRTGIDQPTRMTEIVCVVLAVLACVVAQARALRGAGRGPGRSVTVGDIRRPHDRKRSKTTSRSSDQALPRACWVRVK